MVYLVLRVLLSYEVVGLCGLLFLYCPFSAAGRQAPRWVRLAIWMVGTLTVAWSLFGYAEFHWHPASYPLARQRFFQCKTLCAGGCLALFFLLFASGEFFRAFRRPKNTA